MTNIFQIVLYTLLLKILLQNIAQKSFFIIYNNFKTLNVYAVSWTEHIRALESSFQLNRCNYIKQLELIVGRLKHLLPFYVLFAKKSK